MGGIAARTGGREGAGRRISKVRTLAFWRARLISIVALAAMAAGLAGAAGAQSFTPAPGTPLRTAILDAVRQMVEAEVGAPAEFVVHQFNVLGQWAFVIATPRRPGGGQIIYTHTRYQAANDAGAFSGDVVALVRDTPAGWLVHGHDLGASDAVWYDWQQFYPAPPEVFETR